MRWVVHLLASSVLAALLGCSCIYGSTHTSSVDIMKFEQYSGCCFELSVAILNTEHHSVSLVEMYQCMPELEIRFFSSSGKELSAYVSRANSFSSQLPKVISLDSGEKYAYRSVFFLPDVQRGDAVFVKVMSPFNRDCWIQRMTKVSKATGSNVEWDKGLRPIIRMNKQELSDIKKSISQGKERYGYF